jgi:cell division protein FtsI (penicillin-binding protein 3)
MTDKRKGIVVRFGVIYWIIAFLFVLVIWKIIQIQFVEREDWMKLADRQKITDIIVKPKRGNIYAADGRLLASSIPTYFVYMDMRVPALRMNNGELFYENLDDLSQALSDFFGDKSKNAYRRILLNAYNNQTGNLLLHPNRISYSQLKELRKLPLFELGRFKSGLFEREFVRRVKPFGSLASRTIGNVFADESKGGASGIEASFNDYLIGVNGVSIRQKVANRYIETTDVSPVDGLDVYSTIDVELQDIAEKALRDTIGKLGAISGAVVMMEVATGAIRAMVNLDRNPQSGEYFENRNHALLDQVEPGSTFKIASLMAVLDEGKYKISDEFDIYNGRMPIANRVMRDHNAHRGGYERLRVDEIIHASSNVGTAQMVMGTFGSRPERFIEKLYNYRLNDSLEIQMKGVAKPWIKHPKKDRDKWYQTSLAWISIGYETLMPPIYTLTFFNAIANDGVMVKPLFVEEVRKDGEVVKTYPTEVMVKRICKPSTLKDVREVLKGVVNGKYGTARNMRSELVSIAGKTGTALISQGTAGYRSDQTKYNVSFAGYFPADEPMYSCIVVLNAPEGIPSGGGMAGGVFKEVAERTMIWKSKRCPSQVPVDSALLNYHWPMVKGGNNMELRKVADLLSLPYTSSDSDWVKPSETPIDRWSAEQLSVLHNLLPDVMGLGAKDAAFLLGNQGVVVRLNGRGKVVSQHPAAGTAVKKGGVVQLILN